MDWPAAVPYLQCCSVANIQLMATYSCRVLGSSSACMWGMHVRCSGWNVCCACDALFAVATDYGCLHAVFLECVSCLLSLHLEGPSEPCSMWGVSANQCLGTYSNKQTWFLPCFSTCKQESGTYIYESMELVILPTSCMCVLHGGQCSALH